MTETFSYSLARRIVLCAQAESCYVTGLFHHQSEAKIRACHLDNRTLSIRHAVVSGWSMATPTIMLVHALT